MRVQLLGQEDPWRRKRQPTPAFLPGEFPWTKDLVGVQRSPWGRRESDMTERTHTHTQLLYNVLVSVTQQGESATSIHMSPPSQSK